MKWFISDFPVIQEALLVPYILKSYSTFVLELEQKNKRNGMKKVRKK